MHVMHVERFGTGDQAFADVISAAKQSEANPNRRMFIEKNASFQFIFPTNQHCGAPSVCQSVGGDEVFGVRRQVVFLAAALAQLPNLGQASVEFTVADDQPGCPCGPSLNMEPALES